MAATSPTSGATTTTSSPPCGTRSTGAWSATDSFPPPRNGCARSGSWLAWAIALGVSERWIHAFDGLPVSQPTWYVSRGGFDLDSFDRSLSRFSSGTEQALLTSRRGAGDSWSGGGGLSGGSSGGGMGGGGGAPSKNRPQLVFWSRKAPFLVKKPGPMRYPLARCSLTCLL